MTLIFAVNLLAGFDVHDNNMLRADLFEAEAVRLHKNPILPGNSKRDMAKDIIPVTLVSKNVAGVGELFFEFFDVGGHCCSLTGN
jgi:hypothetical protein